MTVNFAEPRAKVDNKSFKCRTKANIIIYKVWLKRCRICLEILSILTSFWYWHSLYNYCCLMKTNDYNEVVKSENFYPPHRVVILQLQRALSLPRKSFASFSFT